MGQFPSILTKPHFAQKLEDVEASDDSSEDDSTTTDESENESETRSVHEETAPVAPEEEEGASEVVSNVIEVARSTNEGQSFEPEQSESVQNAAVGANIRDQVQVQSGIEQQPAFVSQYLYDGEVVEIRVATHRYDAQVSHSARNSSLTRQ